MYHRNWLFLDACFDKHSAEKIMSLFIPLFLQCPATLAFFLRYTFHG